MKSNFYKKNFVVLTFVLAFLLIGVPKAVRPEILVINLLDIFVVLFVTWRSLRGDVKSLTFLALACLILSYLASAYFVIKEFCPCDLSEPKSEAYRSDESDYLKTFYLMERGGGFYVAHRQALILDQRFLDFKGDVASWRFPTIFYFWKVVANSGTSIRFSFLVLSSICLVSVYFLMKRFMGVIGLLSVYLLIPYFLGSFTDKSFLFIEWWALMFLIFGLTLLVYNKRLLAYLAFVFCAMTRETFLVSVASIVFWDTLVRKRFLLTFLTIGVFALFFLFHLENLGNFSVWAPMSRLHTLNKGLILNVFAFSGRMYEFAFLRQSLILTLLAVVGIIYNFIIYLKRKDVSTSPLLLLAFVPMVIFASFFGTIVHEAGREFYSDYWGISFVPVAIIFAPLFLRIFLSTKAHS